jgi:hypothetical protein
MRLLNGEINHNLDQLMGNDCSIMNSRFFVLSGQESRKIERGK